jgi:cyclase
MRTLYSTLALSAAFLGSGVGTIGAAAPDASLRARRSETADLPAIYSSTVGSVQVLQVRADIYMLTVGDVNIALQTGKDGTVLVDTGPAAASGDIVKAVEQLVDGPIRFIINTSADSGRIGANAAVARTGHAFTRGTMEYTAPIIATQNVLLRMINEPGQQHPGEALPSITYTESQRNDYLNGQAIEVISEPAAHTDGDSFVMFRNSNVVVTGAVFDITRFPIIDVKRGGSIDGEIAALNQLLERLVIVVTPQLYMPGETLVIPGTGPVCDQLDILVYRDMVTIVRDRVRGLIAQKKTLKQIQETNPTRGFTVRYGGPSSGESARRFVESVYLSLLSSQGRRQASSISN